MGKSACLWKSLMNAYFLPGKTFKILMKARNVQNSHYGKIPLLMKEHQLVGAPEYLSVLGHEDCLSTYSPAPGRTEKCIPKSIPDLCIPPAWDELQIVFDGKICPDLPLWQDTPTNPNVRVPSSCTSPTIKWKGCPRIGGLDCDACFSIVYDDAQGGDDTLCMKKGSSNCIFTGKLLSDDSYAAITASSGNCRPFSNNELEVSLSSDRCSGSWIVKDGKATRPPCVFCDGVDGVIDGTIVPSPEI